MAGDVMRVVARAAVKAGARSVVIVESAVVRAGGGGMSSGVGVDVIGMRRRLRKLRLRSIVRSRGGLILRRRYCRR